jgi:hypothetical protein
MGGYGSGRRGYHTKKNTVEECRQLDVGRFHREGMIRRGQGWSGLWAWWNDEGKQTASIGLAATERGVTLQYTIRWRDREPEEMNYQVPVVWTPCNLGGERPWFLCPERRCGCRVAKLYLPPSSARYFLCRHCHDLSYRSRQEYDKRVAWLSKHPEALHRMLNAKKTATGDLLLALKTLDRLYQRL